MSFDGSGFRVFWGIFIVEMVFEGSAFPWLLVLSHSFVSR